MHKTPKTHNASRENVHPVQLSEKLRRLMAEQNLTQEQLGDALGIAHTTVGRWLKGKSRPYDRIAQQLAGFFKIPVEVLTDDTLALPTQSQSQSQKPPIKMVPAVVEELCTRIREEFYLPEVSEWMGRSAEEVSAILRAMADAVAEMERRKNTYMARAVSAGLFKPPDKKP